MIPVEFPEQNVVYAKDQPQYLPLPAHRTDDGRVISSWKLTISERLRVLFGANVWLSQMTFGTPLQPQKPYIGSPFV